MGSCTEACLEGVISLSAREARKALRFAHATPVAGLSRAAVQSRLAIASCCSGGKGGASLGFSIAAFVISIVATLIALGALSMSIIVCCRVRQSSKSSATTVKYSGSASNKLLYPYFAAPAAT